MTKLSVVMPVKNLLQMTEKTIKSLVENTPCLGEIILIDDHSTEDMTKIKGVKYHLNPSTGVNAAWNYGGSLAEYPYIAWLNNDVLFSPNWAEPLIDALNDNVWLVSPYHTSFDLPADFPAGKGRKKNLSPGQTGLPFIGSAFMMMKNWEKVRPIDERLKIYCGDNYIFETITALGKQANEIPESYVHHFISQTISWQTNGLPHGFQEDNTMFNLIFSEKQWTT